MSYWIRSVLLAVLRFPALSMMLPAARCSSMSPSTSGCTCTANELLMLSGLRELSVQFVQKSSRTVLDIPTTSSVKVIATLMGFVLMWKLSSMNSRPSGVASATPGWVMSYTHDSVLLSTFWFSARSSTVLASSRIVTVPSLAAPTTRRKEVPAACREFSMSPPVAVKSVTSIPDTYSGKDRMMSVGVLLVKPGITGPTPATPPSSAVRVGTGRVLS